MAVNHKIRMLRELQQWSQEDMAKRMNMSINGYAKIERGETKLHLDKLEQIAQIFNIDVIELMTAGDNGVVFFMNENSDYTNTNYYGSSEQLTSEIEKLKLIIKHKDELLAQKEAENQLLKELVATLKSK